MEESIKVKMLKMTKWEGQRREIGEVCPVDIETAKRWHKNGIAVMKKEDVKKVSKSGKAPNTKGDNLDETEGNRSNETGDSGLPGDGVGKSPGGDKQA